MKRIKSMEAQKPAFKLHYRAGQGGSLFLLDKWPMEVKKNCDEF